MTDDIKLDLDQRVLRGQRAREFLDSDLVQTAVAELRGDITAKWLSTAANDTDGRETLFKLNLGVDGILGKLKAWADDGSMAQHEINEKNRSR